MKKRIIILLFFLFSRSIYYSQEIEKDTVLLNFLAAKVIIAMEKTEEDLYKIIQNKKPDPELLQNIIMLEEEIKRIKNALIQVSEGVFLL